MYVFLGGANLSNPNIHRRVIRAWVPVYLPTCPKWCIPGLSCPSGRHPLNRPSPPFNSASNTGISRLSIAREPERVMISYQDHIDCQWCFEPGRMFISTAFS